jgi:hypothetical protein
MNSLLEQYRFVMPSNNARREWFLTSLSLSQRSRLFLKTGMIAQTLLTLQDLPFTLKHAILGATSSKNPRSDLGKAMAGCLGAAKKAGKRPDPREMSEVMTRVSDSLLSPYSGAHLRL